MVRARHAAAVTQSFAPLRHAFATLRHARRTRGPGRLQRTARPACTRTRPPARPLARPPTRPPARPHARTPAESYVHALCYIDRLKQSAGIELGPLNTHRVVITAVMLAAKFFDDSHWDNTAFARIGGITIAEVNRMELEMLFATNFNCKVSEVEFARYFREMCEADSPFHSVLAVFDVDPQVRARRCRARRTRTQTYAHTRTHTHTHTHTRTHTQMRAPPVAHRPPRLLCVCAHPPHLGEAGCGALADHARACSFAVCVCAPPQAYQEQLAKAAPAGGG